MEFIDLKSQYCGIQESLHSRIQLILKHGQYIMGPEVYELESQLARYTGSDYCISCSSGTDALLMSLLAQGIGPGDAVFTTPFTFIATAEVIQLLGATPVFVDIQEDTFNLDPDLLRKAIADCLHKGKLKPKAIIPVDLFGLPADYEKIEEIGKNFNLFILDDAAQSFGGSIKGTKSGTFGNASATSFFPAKPLGCYGDGGAVFTDDGELAEKLVSIREHGKGKTKYDNIRTGINGRMDTIQAAVLLEKLKIFPEELIKRNRIADQYRESLGTHFICQEIPNGYMSAWAQFSILAEDTAHRSACQQRLKESEIPTAIYYAKPLHLQMAFKNLGYKAGDFPVSESISQRIFSLPMHPYLTDDNINKICDILITCKEKVL